jgi:MFS transporter, ACS family, hexuronate transporter
MQVERWRWGVVWLLFLATLINYMDRQALASTQRYLLPEFEPDPAKQNAVYADIQFYFGISFGLFQIVAGFLIDRFSLKWLYLGAIVVWSGAGLATGFVPGGAIGLLILCRVILGFGEAFNWPCAVACIRRTIPRESRGLANGIFHSGASLGAFAMPLVVLALVDKSTGAGWRETFVIVGALGFVWVGLWLWFTRGQRASVIDGPPMVDDVIENFGPQLTLWQVFLSGKFAIALTTMIAVNVTWHFYNQWFPRYLTQDLQVEASTEQWVLAGFYISADLGSLAFGRLSRELARRGFTVSRARQIVMLTLALGAILFTVVATGDVARSWQWVGFFFVAANVMGGYSVAFGLVQDVAAKHTAQVLGVCGCLSWLTTSGLTKFVGGYAGPGKYADLFLVIGCVPLVAALVGFLWPREVKRSAAGLQELR